MFEEEEFHISDRKKDTMSRFLRYIGTEMTASNAMPRSTVFLIKGFLKRANVRVVHIHKLQHGNSLIKRTKGA